MDSDSEEEEEEVQRPGEETHGDEDTEQDGEEEEQDKNSPPPKPTALGPIFDGVYYDPDRMSLVVSVISVRKEARAVCERMKEHFGAWMGNFFIQQGYHERTVSSLLDCLGEGAWALTRFGSHFDPNTYKVSVQFAENTEEKRLNRMEQELGYGEESRSSVSGNTPEIKIDMTDVRAMLEAGGCENSMEAHSGVSKMTDAVSTGESTVNPDCAVRNREKHLHTHLENCRLKGQIEEREAETAALRSKVEELATNMAMLMSGVGGTPEQLLMRMQEISGRHSELTPPTAPGDRSPALRKAGVRFFRVCWPCTRRGGGGIGQKASGMRHASSAKARDRHATSFRD